MSTILLSKNARMSNFVVPPRTFACGARALRKLSRSLIETSCISSARCGTSESNSAESSGSAAWDLNHPVDQRKDEIVERLATVFFDSPLNHSVYLTDMPLMHDLLVYIGYVRPSRFVSYSRRPKYSRKRRIRLFRS